jgi:hypothetical protein
VIAGSLALFLVVFALLVFQLRAGRDPALGASAQPAAVPAKRILHRRVVITKKIITIREREPDAEGTAVAQVPQTSVQAAPVQSAPPPAAPAAPAPAPAPLATRSS